MFYRTLQHMLARAGLSGQFICPVWFVAFIPFFLLRSLPSLATVCLCWLKRSIHLPRVVRRVYPVLSATALCRHSLLSACAGFRSLLLPLGAPSLLPRIATCFCFTLCRCLRLLVSMLPVRLLCVCRLAMPLAAITYHRHSIPAFAGHSLLYKLFSMKHFRSTYPVKALYPPNCKTCHARRTLAFLPFPFPASSSYEGMYQASKPQLRPNRSVCTTVRSMRDYFLLQGLLIIRGKHPRNSMVL